MSYSSTPLLTFIYSLTQQMVIRYQKIKSAPRAAISETEAKGSQEY